MESNDSLPSGVICQVCSKPFSDPRMLPCLHSFCFQCIYNLPISTEHDYDTKGSSLNVMCWPDSPPDSWNKSIQCPTCLTHALVPVGGANLFPSDLHLGFEVEVARYVSKFGSDCAVSCTFCVNGCGNRADRFCCNCLTFLCRTAQDCHRHVAHLSHHSVIELDKNSAKLLADISDSTEHCCSQPKHESKELDLYCNTCCSLICSKCVVELHKEHNITPLSIIAESHRDEMKEALECVQKIIPALDVAIDDNQKMIHQVETSKQEAEQAIEDTFGNLVEILKERKKALLSQLDTISLSKVTSLTLQKEHFEKIQQNIDHGTKVTSHILQTHTDQEIVALGGQVPTELKAILKKVQNVSFIPNQRSYFKFLSAPYHESSNGRVVYFKNRISTDALFRYIPTLGAIENLSPSPQHSECKFIPIAAWINTKCCIKLKTMSSKTKNYPYGGLQIKTELRPNTHDGPVLYGEVEDHGDGTYTITLTPQTAGPHQLLITMDGQQVQGSPFDLRVRGDYTSLYNPHQIICVNKPYCVAVDKDTKIYVGSGDDHLSMFDQSGHLIKTIGRKGSRFGQYNGPFGIFIKDDEMLVADSGNHRIQKLETIGGFLESFGEVGSGQEQLNEPCDVVVDSNNRVIVSDSKNDRIQIFRNGSWILTIDGRRFGDQSFEDPRGVALDPEENIHVAAYGSNAVKVFTPDGTYVRTYGDLEGPYGIAIDEKGYCFVTEERCNCLNIYDPKGCMIHMVALDLNIPRGVALDHTGSVYISNFGSDNVFRYVY